MREAKVRSFSSSWLEIEGDLRLDSSREMDNAEDRLGEGAIGLHDEDVEGRLVALEDAYGKVLGIGTICGADYWRGSLRIRTRVEGAVSKIRVGMIRLDREGKEVL